MHVTGGPPAQALQPTPHDVHATPATLESASYHPGAQDVQAAGDTPEHVEHAASQGAQATPPVGSVSTYPGPHEVHVPAAPVQEPHAGPHTLHTTPKGTTEVSGPLLNRPTGHEVQAVAEPAHAAHPASHGWHDTPLPGSAS